MTSALHPALGLGVFRTLVTIRRFEEHVLDLRRRNLIAGSVHLCLGQEAVPAAAMTALENEDRVVATYRGHGWALAAGIDPAALMAEICQRASGINGGRGGSPYLSAPDQRFIGENSIVGAGLPIADGLALAARVQGRQRVIVASFGDGATNQGAAHEALVMAVARRLPVVFVCENNGWSEMTPIGDIVAGTTLARRAEAYGMPALTLDGTDPAAIYDAVVESAARARAGDGPTFLECLVPRLGGHYNADVQHYRPENDAADARRRDPLPALRTRLLTAGSDAADLERIEAAVAAALEDIVEQTLAAPEPDPSTSGDHVSGPVRIAHPGRSGPTTELTYGAAVGAALARELDDRPETVLFGEDVAIPGGVFGVSRGLGDRFGGERVFDTAIAESAILGMAVGAAIDGLRPVVEIMWADFLLVALDQLVNQAANVRYLSRGTRSAPLLVRCQQGVTPGSCAQHSQSLEALLAHIPGLRVGLPATPQDAYAMTRAAIADDDPCVLIESRALYGRKGPVALDDGVEPVSGARLRRDGDDLAILTWGRMLDATLAAADRLAGDGIDASVLDLRWLAPLDDAAIAELMGRCDRVLIAHEANRTGGFGAEVAARIADRHLFELDGPIRRVASPDIRYPSAPALQQALLPGADDVVAAARELLEA